MDTPNLATIGFGAVGAGITAFITAWWTNRNQHGQNVDSELAKIRAELAEDNKNLRAEIEKVRNECDDKLEAQDAAHHKETAELKGEITVLRTEVNSERNARYAFEIRIWNMLRYQVPKKEWEDLEQELAEKHGPQRRRQTDVTAHILLADDSDDLRSGMEKAFLLEGFSVETAPSGKVAIQLYDSAVASDARFDLLIIDYSMACEKTGGEVARVIRQERKDKKTPIVIYTGHVGEIQEDLSAYDVHLWVKPLDMHDMCDRARVLIKSAKC